MSTGSSSPRRRKMRMWSGERALERGSVGGRSMRGEDELDRQVEQRTQRLDGLLACHALGEPVGRKLEAAAQVDERVADDERSMALDPEHEVVPQPSRERLDSARQPIPG